MINLEEIARHEFRIMLGLGRGFYSKEYHENEYVKYRVPELKAQREELLKWIR